ncbi:drug/metabolite transporter (DMT)-like permease [Bacillus oleivorans]|uniref:Drug/metabolite transporter (DMT)-like permease n=1 Tax=Bacillus oleivorans TaxID=1448271 RepID=A0A285CJ02_9BACI|nr:DMT family transporter [Bacillus oleivorans]SNX66963.1 drug/metabolite transporter (DMT)-like permease [Bacillus oleivorans]
MSKNVLGAICLTAAASIWGGMYVVSKYSLDQIPPFGLMWLRYLLGFGLLYAILKGTRQKDTRPLRKKDWFQFAWIGLIGYFISIAAQFWGTKLSNASMGSLITSASPAFIFIFAWILLKEKLTVKKLAALILSTIGVIMVIGLSPSQSQTSLLGNLILVIAAVTWALLSVFVKMASAHHSSLVITTYAVGFGWLWTTPFFIWEAFTVGWSFSSPLLLSLSVIYLGFVSTAGAFFLWNKGLELMEAGIGSLFFFFQPLVGSILGWLLLSEDLSMSFLMGAILILTAVGIATYQRTNHANNRINLERN